MPLLVQVAILLVALAIVLPVLLWIVLVGVGLVAGLWLASREIRNEERKSRGQ